MKAKSPRFNWAIEMKSIKLTSTLALTLFLGACSQAGNFADLQTFTDEVKLRPGGSIEPVPAFKDYDAFTYSAAGFRSPFDIPIRIQLQDGQGGDADVEPDLERAKEPLENFAIAELAMVGMVERNGNYVALVESNVGDVHRVLLGNYVGRNHGRVVDITSSQVDLIEIVPSGSGGWMERPNTLALAQ